MRTILHKSALLVLSLSALLSFSAYADRDSLDRHERNVRSEHKFVPAPNVRVDRRYDHNHSYPKIGHTIPRLPERRHPIHYKNRDYFYFSGTWYLPSGPNFTVVVPPIGIVVPILPPFYTTVWFGDIPYYYANNIYYVWRPDLNGYQVTNPPKVESQAEPTYMAEELFIYPKQGQSEQQQADDRYACHRQSVEQTGYDPTEPPTGLSTEMLSQKREDYHRSMMSCLEGKGYSVR
jgi:hypothetical protein